MEEGRLQLDREVFRSVSEEEIQALDSEPAVGAL